MNDINFQPIFEYIDEAEKRIKAEMASKADIEKVLSAVTAIATNYKKTDDKVSIQESKTERIEHWVIKAAEKVEVPYKP